MHFYSLNYDEVRSLPINVFWELVRNVGRIQADGDLRLLRVLGGLFEAKNVSESLLDEIGEICKYKEEGFDRDGFEKLRFIFSKQANNE